MDKFKLIIFSVLVAIFSFTNISIAQYSLGGGISTFHGLNLPIHRFGFNFFAEIPKSPNNTFSIRAVYMLPNKNTNTVWASGKTPAVSPAQIQVTEIGQTSYFAIDGGSRFYFINDYDIGFAVYAGGFIKGILSSYKSTYDMNGDYSKSDYITEDNRPLEGSPLARSIFISFGGSVGIKYQLPTRGAFTFDVSGEVISRLMDPYQILGNEISPVSFSMNLAYRFDWY